MARRMEEGQPLVVAEPKKAVPNNSKYEVSELVANNHLFKTTKDIVAAALSQKGEAAFTVKEATKIIDDFKAQKPGQEKKGVQ